MGESERTALVLEVVDNQIREGNPPETSQTLERLIGEGISVDDGKLHIAQALIIEILDTFRNKKKFNLERYLRNLENLPDEPSEE